MYHAIVGAVTRRMFDQVTSQDYERILGSCSPDIHHRFGGNHALGGERHDVEALRLWFQRLGRLFPSLELKVRDVWVKGFPWDTTVIARWDGTGRFPDGSPYDNHGVHIIRLQWGKVAAIDAHEDSQVVSEMLNALMAAGVSEAGAAPITS